MSDYNETHVDFDWEAEGAIPISRREAEEDIFKKVPTPVFKLVKGKERHISDLPMAVRAKIGSDPVNSHPSELLEMRPCKKSSLPMFSFCVDGLVHAVVLDVESGVPLFNVLEALKEFEYLAYFSASSEIERPRFRVVLPLSVPVKAEVFDYCRDKLHQAFAEIADKHSFESKRFFFMASALTGPWRESNELKTNAGAAIDFYGTTGFDILQELKMSAKQKRKGEFKHRDMSEDERVQYYLSTSFPLMRGNGDSASSFYTAICVCLANGDEETLDEVLDKARSENWSEREIKSNLTQARRFLAKK